MHRLLPAIASALLVLIGVIAAPVRADDIETCKSGPATMRWRPARD